MDLTRLLSHSTKKPKSILRIVISISMVLLVLWLFMVSRMELSTQRQSVLVANQPDSVAAQQSIKQSLLNESPARESQNLTAKQEQPAIFQKALTTFLLMFIVLGFVWLWSKKKSSSQQVKEDISDLGQHILGQGAQLRIVEINNEVWVLGVTSGSLTLLHRYAKEEWNANKGLVDNNEAFPQEVEKPDFKAIYSLFGN